MSSSAESEIKFRSWATREAFASVEGKREREGDEEMKSNFHRNTLVYIYIYIYTYHLPQVGSIQKNYA